MPRSEELPVPEPLPPDLSKAVQDLAEHLAGRSEERRQKVLAMARMLSGTPSSTPPSGSTGSSPSGSAPVGSTNSATFSTEEYLMALLPGVSRETIDRYLDET